MENEHDISIPIIDYNNVILYILTDLSTDTTSSNKINHEHEHDTFESSPIDVPDVVDTTSNKDGDDDNTLSETESKINNEILENEEDSDAIENELSSGEAVTSATDADTDFDTNINNHDDLEPNMSSGDLTENVEMKISESNDATSDLSNEDEG